MLKNSKTVQKIGLLPSACVGTGLAIVTSLICSAVAATVISSGKLNEDSATILKLITQFLSATIGALIAAVIAIDKKTLCCIITGAMYIFTLIAFAILVFSGISTEIFGGILVCFIGSFVAIIVINKKNIKQVQRKTKRRYR